MKPGEARISIAEAARRLDINRSTLGRQAKSGDIRCHDGLVYFSEVLEDRANNIDLTRSKRRAGEPDDVGHDATADATAAGDATDVEDGEPVLVDGVALPYKDARALKETYLARLRKLEFEIKSGAFVAIEKVGLHVEREYAVLRETLLTLPGKVAASLVGRNEAQIETELRLEVGEALQALSGAPLS